MSEQDQFSKQIDLLVGSATLHGSESLCKLLRYLGQHAIEEPGVRLKEYQIATEVFGRRPDFDPQSDSMIRVQAGRLRAKLSEYYSAEGANDGLVVELPKGTYQLQFHRRASVESKDGPPAPIGSRMPEVPQGKSSPNWKLATVMLSLLCVVLLIGLASLETSRKMSPTVLAGAVDSPPPEFLQLWKPFVTGPQEPWLVFSNAAFTGRPETGMRYYNPARDPAGPVWDHYTGVGEVLAVHELDQVFGTLHRQMRVKRGSLFSLDDVKNNDLIFLGSPAENLTLTEIPSTRQFVFQRMADGPRKGDLALVNTHPQGDEPKTFLATPSGSPLTEDYAVVALMPGLDPSRSVMIIAGTTTFGTQGAVEYLCRRNTLAQLLPQLPVSRTGELNPFEALLRVKVTHGVPVEAELVAVRH